MTTPRDLLALRSRHADTLGNGCPCLLQWARNPRITFSASQRTISWDCSRCGGHNSETETYPPKRHADVLHGTGGARDGLASVMGSTIGGR